MGYRKIPNLYKDQTILMFRECYALEKIHGTSARIDWRIESSGDQECSTNNGKISFFSGGAKHDDFVALFDETELEDGFIALGHAKVSVYGEAYGGKLQGMRETYGDQLRFVVFEVKIGDTWLCVPDAAEVADKLGLEYVLYKRIRCDLADIDSERDAPSVQAMRNGITKIVDGMFVNLKPREGIVLRPLIECRKSNGDRVIVKHKNEAFMETRTPRKVGPEKLKVLQDAEAIAPEWVTDMRLAHVLDKLGNPREIERTGDVCRAMVADVEAEGEGEIEWSKEARKAIGKRAAMLYKAKLTSLIDDGEE